MKVKTYTKLMAGPIALSVSLVVCFADIAPIVIVGAIAILGIFIMHCYIRWETEK